MNEWEQQLKRKLEKWYADLSEMAEEVTPLQTEIQTLINEIDKPLRVNILGEFKAGKSTFINALFKEELVVSDVNAATAVTTILKYGAERTYKAVLTSGQVTDLTEEMFSQLSAETSGKLQEMRKRTDHLIVELPIELLKKMTIVDTPGFGARTDHDNMTSRHIHNCDCALWLFPYGLTGTPGEKEKLRQLNGWNIPVFGIMNKVDQHDDDVESLETYLKSVGRLFQGQLQSLIPISAGLALTANKTNDQKLLEDSNWSAIEDLFKDLFGRHIKEDRVYRQLSELVQFTDDLLETKKSELSFTELQKKLYRILEYYMPELKTNYVEMKDYCQSARQLMIAISRLFDVELHSEETINEHLDLLEEVEKFEALELTQAVDWNSYYKKVKEIDEFNFKLSEQQLKKERILLDFEAFDMKNRKTKNECEELLERQQRFNRTILDLKQMEINRSASNKPVRQNLSKYTQELTQKLVYLNTTKTNELNAVNNQWTKLWEHVNEEITSIDSKRLEELEQLREFLDSYKSTLGEFVQENYLSISDEREQKRILNSNYLLMNMMSDIPTEKLDEARTSLYAMQVLFEQPSHEHEKIIKATLFPSRTAIALPDPLNLPIERTLLSLRKRTKRRNNALIIAALLALAIWQWNGIVDITSSVKESTMSFLQSAQAGEESEVPDESKTYNTPSVTGNVEKTPVAETVQAKPTAQAPPKSEEKKITTQPIDDYELRQALGGFVIDFRDNYEYAVNNGDFSYVEGFFNSKGSAYKEIRDYIQDIAGKGTYFEFETNQVDRVLAVSNGNYIVRTEEVFLFTGNEGEQWRYYKEKEYVLTQNASGYMQILEMRNLKNDKQRVY